MIFLKHGGYDGYTETGLPDLSMAYWLLLLLLLSFVTVRVSPPSPWFPSCFRYFIDGNKLELHDFFKAWWI